MDAAIRELFDPYVVDDPVAPANYSIDHLGVSIDPARAVKVLYRDATPVVRSRSTARLLEGLVRHVAGEHTTSDDLLELRVLALTRARSAVFLPASLRSRLVSLGPHLRRQDLRVLDEPAARVNAATGELVVTSPDLAVDWQVLATLAERGLDGDGVADDPPVATGHYRSKGLYLRPAQNAPDSRAHALVAMAGLARNAALFSGQDLLAALASFARRCPVLPLPETHRDAGLASALRTIADDENATAAGY